MIFNRSPYWSLRDAGLGMVVVFSLCLPQVACGATSDAPLQTAHALIDGHKLSEARALLDNYLQANPHCAEAHFLLGYVLFRENMAKQSLAEFTAGAQIVRPSTADLKIIAADYVLLGDFDDADKWLTSVVMATPQDADAWYLLGRTKYNENRFAEAIDSFSHAVALRPHDVKAEDNLGLSYEGLNEMEKAKAAFQTAIAWQADSGIQDAQPLLNLGSLLLRESRGAAAVSYLIRAAAAAPGNAKVHEELSQAYLAENELPKAQTELEIAIKLAPNASALHYKLGQILHRLGYVADSQREFKICAELLNSHSSTDIPNPPSPQ